MKKNNEIPLHTYQGCEKIKPSTAPNAGEDTERRMFARCWRDRQRTPLRGKQRRSEVQPAPRHDGAFARLPTSFIRWATRPHRRNESSLSVSLQTTQQVHLAERVSYRFPKLLRRRIRTHPRPPGLGQPCGVVETATCQDSPDYR